MKRMDETVFTVAAVAAGTTGIWPLWALLGTFEGFWLKLPDVKEIHLNSSEIHGIYTESLLQSANFPCILCL